MEQGRTASSLLCSFAPLLPCPLDIGHHMTTYNLSSLKLPTLRGRTLRLFAAALDSPLQGAMVSQLL